MHVVVYLDVVLRVPRGHGRDEVRLGLRRQLQVPFHVFLSTVGGGHTLHAHSNKSTSVQRVHAYTHTDSSVLSRTTGSVRFTSLMKSSCFLSSASIARSSMPPGVALRGRGWQQNNSRESSAVRSSFSHIYELLTHLWPMTNRMTMPFSSSIFLLFSPAVEWNPTAGQSKFQSAQDDTCFRKSTLDKTNLEASMSRGRNLSSSGC